MAGISFGSALWETTLQERIPNAVLSRVSSYEWLVSFAFMPIGFLLFGPLADAIGISTTFIVAAGVMVVANVLVAISPPIHDVGPEQSATPIPSATPKTRAAA